MRILFIFLLTLWNVFCFGQPPFEAKPGKCYAKCEIPNQYEESEIEFFEYTGNNFSSQNISLKKIPLESGSKVYHKTKLNDCIYNDEKDCFTWTEIKLETPMLKYYIVNDTSLEKSYSTKKIKIKKIITIGGYTEWKEILCQGSITSILIENIKIKLFSLGYLSSVPSGKQKSKWDEETKSALKKFQVDNSLPIGALDFETITKLGVNIE